MASGINIAVYSDALVVLGTAGVVVPMVRRWGLNPVLGYLCAGAILGPLGLGTFIQQIPLLYWLTVVDDKNVAVIADLGVVFLLFLIGLELTYERLMAMRRLVFGLGGLQIAISTAAIAGVGLFAGLTAPVAIIIGACLAFSSTAIVLEILSNQNRLTTSAGRASFATLLAQDMAVVPLLIYISVLGDDSGQPLLQTAGTALLQAVAAVAIIALVGRVMLRPLFRLVATTRSSELFIATILFVIVGTGVMAAVAGLSMALGAFVAGLLLAETEYRKTIEATIEPFKGLLLGIFFFTVGMKIDARELLRDPVWLLAGVTGLIALKTAITFNLARAFKLSRAAAVEVGLLLAPAGEFAFVGIGLATTLGIISGRVSSFTLALTSLTMLLIPAMSQLSRRYAKMVEKPKQLPPDLLIPPTPRTQHAIVIGYGRVGKVVCSLLREHGVPYTATDNDAIAVSDDRRKQHDVSFGDATEPAFLKTCGLMDASGIIITIHNQANIDQIVKIAREVRPEVLIVARARDANHARHLYSVGVTDAVPETIEASLQLSEAALVGLGIPSGPVIASIHEQRDGFRRYLQEAAQQAGHPNTHSIRPKTTISRPGATDTAA